MMNVSSSRQSSLFIVWLRLLCLFCAAMTVDSVSGQVYTLPGSTATVMGAVYSRSSSDLFDVTQGARVLSASPTYGNPDGCLGGAGFFEGAITTLFGDGGPAGSVKTLVFSVPNPVSVNTVFLGFSQDGPLTRRGAAGYSLFGLQSPSDGGVLLSTATFGGNYELDYGRSEITVQDTFPTFTGSFFRLNVVQRTEHFGPRIQALDGFFIPEAVLPNLSINVERGTRTQAEAGHATLSGTIPVLKIGNGTLVLGAANTFSSTLFVSEGTAIAANVQAIGTATLNVSAGAAFAVSPLVGAASPVQISDLGTIAGRIDIGTGRIEISPGGTSEADLRALLIAGRGTGNFAGASGIVTSAPNPSPLFVPVVGYRFDPTGAATVAWAAFGDADLDGVVTTADVNALLTSGLLNAGISGALWQQGDFDYDGFITTADVNALLTNGLLNTGNYLPALAAPAAVPEPATYLMLLTGISCCQRRRKG